MSERDYHAEMKLPEGKTCNDCIHYQRCNSLFHADGNTSCDFHPRLFSENRAALNSGKEGAA